MVVDIEAVLMGESFEELSDRVVRQEGFAPARSRRRFYVLRRVQRVFTLVSEAVDVLHVRVCFNDVLFHTRIPTHLHVVSGGDFIQLGLQV